MKLFDVYPLLLVSPVKALGSRLWDDAGNEYLDLYGGHAVISIGHSHPHYVRSITAQLDQIGFYSNSVHIPQQKKLSYLLGVMSGYEDYNLFLCNSGAEANENAMKLASFHTGRKKIISFAKAFHGRTSAAVAATDDKSIQAPINENENMIICEWENQTVLENVFLQHEIAAVIIEGIQGVAGVRVPSSPFLKKIEQLCKKNRAMMICDEIQSGYGRSGKFFAHQHANVKPDIITVAKGMGNGFPVAGVLIHPEIQAKYGLLGTTFGGSHLACSAANAVLEVIEQENLINHAAQIGEYMNNELKSVPGIKEVRGLGLMIGIELYESSAEVRMQLLNKYHIFVGSASNKNTLRILPALNLSKEDANFFLDAFRNIMNEKTKSIKNSELVLS
ncbi:MAG TPA: aminotransferase class III-fold pyridoxal phosphate-dependent enzyme [Saprospiraceae bacterium]|nr:aminotransferase class III-fold pyridoxal phosphate-dependent enzyme [Saprospiraceae bacterium]